MGRWLILGPDGEREQICTRGSRTPSDDGANPLGWRELAVASHSPDLDGQEFDEGSRRWRKCPVRAAGKEARERERAQAWLDAMPAGAIELLAETVAERMSSPPAAQPTEQGTGK